MAKQEKKEVLVVGSKVKAFIKGKKGKTSGDLICALSDRVECLLEKAVKRAQENKRTTVRPCDL